MVQSVINARMADTILCGLQLVDSKDRADKAESQVRELSSMAIS